MRRGYRLMTHGRVEGLDRMPDPNERRRSLTADLSRAGYLRGAFSQHGEEWSSWFQTELVLSRPGLLGRCAALLEEHVPSNADRITARGGAAIALASAISIQSNTAMLFCTNAEDGSIRVGGDLFPGARVVVIEDVVLTGQHALETIDALRETGLAVVGVIGLLDREQNGRFRIEEERVPTHFAFREGDLQP